MARDLLTSWSEASSAIQRLLLLARQEILVFDSDLTELRLETLERTQQLERVLQTGGANIRFAVRDARALRSHCPRLQKLLRDYSHSFLAMETAENLSHLRDSMVLVDRCHGFIRFDKEQPRSKVLIDEPDELSGYLGRFAEIWQEGGTLVAPTTLGL